MYTNKLLNKITPDINNFKQKLLNPAKKSIIRILGISAPIIAGSTAIKSTASTNTVDTYDDSELKYNENYIYNQEWQRHTFAYKLASKDKDIYENCIKGKSKQQQKNNLELIKKLKEALSEEELYESFFDPLNQYLKPGILTDENGIIDETRALNFIKEVERRKKNIEICLIKRPYGRTVKAVKHSHDLVNKLDAIVLGSSINDDGTIESDYVYYANVLKEKLRVQGIEKIDKPGALFGFEIKILDRYYNYEPVLQQILKEIKEYVVKTYGCIDKNYMGNFMDKLEADLRAYDLFSDNKTLEGILSPKLKQKLGFKKNLTDLSAEEILQQYNHNYEYYKRFPEITSLLSGIFCHNNKNEELYSFLYHVTADKELGREFVNNINAKPVMGNTLQSYIIEKLGGGAKGKDLYDKWYNDEQYGYKKAYTDFYNEFFGNANDLMTIVKQSPNVAPWAFLSKAKELGVEPTLGELPIDFGTLNEFRMLIDELIKFDKDYNSKYSKPKYKDIKDAEHYITINDKLFKVEKLRGGMSAKTKYKVISDNGEEYIIKFNEYDAIGNTWRSTQIRENQAMRGDSPYLDAMVDFYLKENNCHNAADVQFFDYKSKAVVYKITTGERPDFDTDMFQNLYTFNNSKLAEGVRALGIILNDINDGNFIKDQHGKYILIDTGHAEFVLPFRPMVSGKHISLSNLCGRDLK